MFSRRGLTGYGTHKRNPDLPPLTEAQAEATDAVEFLAQRFSLGMGLQRGDIQYGNNIGFLHGRDGFRDEKG